MSKIGTGFVARTALAALCLAAVIAVLLRYPGPVWPLSGLLVLQAVLLWRWPWLWLVVVPAALPALDLAPWTGWLMVSEADLVILVSLALLLFREPPAIEDLWPPGRTGWILGGTVAVMAFGTICGLTSSVGTIPADNAYLRPDNALRIIKGFVEAIVLLPFLSARQRRHADVWSKFGAGMMTGLAAVSLETLIERAVFPGIFDLGADYRVVGPFSSMHLGGGHIGAYAAMALPFLVTGLMRRSWLTRLIAAAIGTIGVYTLIVSFARAAYASALIATVVMLIAWFMSGRNQHRRWVDRLAAVFVLTLIAGGILFAAMSNRMANRLSAIVPDFGAREVNWVGGMSLTDPGISTVILGMGIGTFPRTVLARREAGSIPTNFKLSQNPDGNFVTLYTGTSLYFGQKVPVQPDQSYRLTLELRQPETAGTLDVLLCEKLLLYSQGCDGTKLKTSASGRWETVETTLSTNFMSGETGLAQFRPIELSFSNEGNIPGVQFRNIALRGPDGTNLIVNGDFQQGHDNWYFTDDDHWAWRMENRYLMLLFDGGILGLATFLLISVAAFGVAYRRLLQGDRMAAAFLAAIAAFLASGIFDSLIEAPRIAALYYLILMACFATVQRAARKGAGHRPRQTA